MTKIKQISQALTKIVSFVVITSLIIVWLGAVLGIAVSLFRLGFGLLG